MRKALFINCLVLFSAICMGACMSFGPAFGPADVVLNKEVAQAKYKRIAVIEFDVSGYDGQGIDQVSSTAFVDRYSAVLMGIGYDVVERQRLKHSLKEHELSMTGLMNQKTAHKVGNLLGIQGYVIGSVSGKPNAFSVMSKLIDVETGSTVWTIVLSNNIEKNGAAALKKALEKHYAEGGR